MSMLFANTLKRLRTEKGLSRKELEERMYVTRSTIARWENGTRLPDVAMISRLVLAFLDIELRNTTGLELCRALLDINPRTNVVYLTAYSDYALDAWSTGACGFMLKPITSDGVREQLGNLRYPFRTGGVEE